MTIIDLKIKRKAISRALREIHEGGCTCFKSPPCSFCMSLTEQEVDILDNGGIEALRLFWASEAIDEHAESRDSQWWLSWYESSHDFRPIVHPPNQNILGWWHSGYDSNNDATLCAMVKAKTADEAWSYIIGDWPGEKRKRFEEKHPIGYRPGDRFPLNEWMKDRFDKVESCKATVI